MTAPDPAWVVQQQVFPPGPPPPDAITVYDGVDPSRGQKFSFRAWDLRGPILKLTWDLLRFRPLTAAKGTVDPTLPRGLYDWVLRTAYVTEENNRILRALAKKTGVDLTGLIDQ